MTTATKHAPVLLDEVLKALEVKAGDTVLDATVGGGGHAEALCKELGKEGLFIGIDQDSDALERTKERLLHVACKTVFQEANFRNLHKILETVGIATVDKALFDLGWSSDQIADPKRGLSFQHDGPLTMTLKKNPTPADITAFDVVNNWEEETLADIFYAFGDERYSRRIAKGIVEARKEKSLRTTHELVDIIRASVPGHYRNGRIHPATRTFQALRIIVNDEYNAVTEALEAMLMHMNEGARIAVITFHSGEDKLIKEFFKQKANDQVLVLITKKPIQATKEEIQENRRSRSAKLRVIQKL